MHLEISLGNAQHIQVPLAANLPSPRIKVNEVDTGADLGMQWDKEACQIDVETRNGQLARFWVSVRVQNGRPKVCVTTDTDKGDNRTEIKKSITGAFYMPNSAAVK